MPELVCPAGHADRLDRTIARFLPDVSRALARKLIDAGSVYVDGRRCRVASRTVHAGTRIQLSSSVAPRREGEEAPLEILYEDDLVIGVDKPAGVPSAPTRQAAVGTAMESLRRQLRDRGEAAPQLFLVHRLDAATSGVLLFARNEAAAATLGAAFATGSVGKEYLAVATGEPPAPSGRVELPLRTVGGRALVSERGRAACTDWEVVEHGSTASLLRVWPRTGRLHQIRAHLAAIGYPIVGDREYGGPAASRLMLHARRIRFAHPASGGDIVVESAVPAAISGWGLADWRTDPTDRSDRSDPSE